MADLVKIAKAISALTKVPLPLVAAVMQKYPPDGSSAKQCLAECEKLAAAQMNKDLKKIFNL